MSSASDRVVASVNVSPRRRWVVLAILAGSQTIVSLDATIVNTALPTIKRVFEMSESQSLWVVDAYLVLFGGLLLSAGALGDRFGRRRILAIGLTVFTLASIGVAFSPNAETLIVGRGLQGIGGALVLPQTLSTLTAVFPRQERSKAFGIWAGAMGIGMALGPFLGGTLVDQIDWSAVFWVPAPLSAMALVALTLVPPTRSVLHTKLDVPGALTGTVGMLALVFSIIEGIPRGWDDPVILATITVAVLSLTSFILIERRTIQPLMPLGFFKQRDFVGAMVGMFFIMFALMGVLFYLPQFFQLVQGVSAAESGLRVMPLAVVMIVCAPIAGFILPKVGPRFLLFWAPTMHGGGCLLILALVLAVDTPYWMVGLALAWLGIGGSLHMPATTDTSMAAVPVDMAGKASAVTTTGQELGGTMSIAILGSFAAVMYASGVRDGLSGLPLSTAEVDVMASGIGAAYHLLPGLDPGVLGEVQATLTDSFVQAIRRTFLFGISFAVVAGVVGWILVPRRQRLVQATSLGGPETAPMPTVSANGALANGTDEVTPLVRSMATSRPQKSGVP
ncbi:MAG: MFS transporter [Chloroflexi bacterium]|nr:MFS transporter [Chloroflexota bacterium]MYF82091.1 MFS transporter [Chloroflexota bacterium]MYI03733.1 MFS transporter [Chloroflexota bacterium]